MLFGKNMLLSIFILNPFKLADSSKIDFSTLSLMSFPFNKRPDGFSGKIQPLVTTVLDTLSASAVSEMESSDKQVRIKTLR